MNIWFRHSIVLFMRKNFIRGVHYLITTLYFRNVFKFFFDETYIDGMSLQFDNISFYNSTPPPENAKVSIFELILSEKLVNVPERKTSKPIFEWNTNENNNNQTNHPKTKTKLQERSNAFSDFGLGNIKNSSTRSREWNAFALW